MFVYRRQPMGIEAQLAVAGHLLHDPTGDSNTGFLVFGRTIGNFKGIGYAPYFFIANDLDLYAPEPQTVVTGIGFGNDLFLLCYLLKDFFPIGIGHDSTRIGAT